jgi:hypothetical protein
MIEEPQFYIDSFRRQRELEKRIANPSSWAQRVEDTQQLNELVALRDRLAFRDEPNVFLGGMCAGRIIECESNHIPTR